MIIEASGSVRSPPRDMAIVSTCLPPMTRRHDDRPSGSENVISSIVFGKPQMPRPAAHVNAWSTGNFQIHVARRLRMSATAAPSHGMPRGSSRRRTKNASDTSL